MIIEIALGIVLAVVILRYWQEIIGAGILVAVGVTVLTIIGVIAFAIYFASEAISLQTFVGWVAATLVVAGIIWSMMLVAQYLERRFQLSYVESGCLILATPIAVFSCGLAASDYSTHGFLSEETRFLPWLALVGAMIVALTLWHLAARKRGLPFIPLPFGERNKAAAYLRMSETRKRLGYDQAEDNDKVGG